MRRQHKTYEKPKRPFDKARIDEEAQLKKEFGLKNKKEIWKAESEINSIREKAKRLIPASEEEQQEFFQRLKKMGLEVGSIHDALSLDKRDYLNRRLQTVVHKKGLANSARHARQIITHKKVLVNGRKMNRPSYIVPTELESTIEVVKPKKPSESGESSGEQKEKESEEKNTEETKENQEQTSEENKQSESGEKKSE